MSRIGQGIKKSVLTANSVLYAVTASVPAALSMAASRIVARLASGNIVAATVAELLTLIGVAAGADVTGNNPPQSHTLGSHTTHSGVKLDDLGTPDDNTNLDFDTARHGLVPKGTNAGDFLKDDGTWGAAGGGAGDYPMKIKPNIVRWTVPGWFSGGRTTQTFTAGRIYYIPIFVEETTTYIRIGGQVSTLSTGTADLRIFEWDGGVPGALILSAGTISVTSTGLKEINISQELTRGYYFLAIRCTATPKFWCLDADRAARSPVSGMSITGDNSVGAIIMIANAAYTDPAPAPTAIEYNLSEGAAVTLREA